MSTSRITNDEETPLLQGQKRKRTPLPVFQISILLVLQLAEPLTSQVIYPFLPNLVRDVGITHGDETKVGYYVGILQSLFFLTQAVTVLHWSRLSDRIGRKPVVLIGLFGLSLSMFCFGLSTIFWGAVVSRSLNGALNGNIGIMKSMIAELTDSTNIAVAYGLMPIAWASGGTLGPMIGGSLSHPAERFPNTIWDSAFNRIHPYFLACAVPATFSAIVWLISLFFLKETLPTAVSFSRIFRPQITKPSNVIASHEPNDSNDSNAKPLDGDKVQPVTLRGLLTRRVILSGGNYALLSFVDICIRGIQPLFYSTPVQLGGLGLTPPQIGQILSVYGILNGIAQVLFFARVHDRFGSKRTFMGGVIAAIPVFLLFPLINIAARVEGYGVLLWALVTTQIFLSLLINFSYGAIFIYLTGAAPNKASLGATVGITQVAVSVTRAIGPATAASLFSLSMKIEFLGGWLVYHVLMVLTCVSVYFATLLPKEVWA